LGKQEDPHHLSGTGVEQQWTVRVTTITRQRFEAGAATAVGLARSSTGATATDAHQWLVNVTLVVE